MGILKDRSETKLNSLCGYTGVANAVPNVSRLVDSTTCEMKMSVSLSTALQ